jgi:hypothetical protein
LAGPGSRSTRTGRLLVRRRGSGSSQAFVGLVGLSGPVRFVDPSDDARAAVALAVLGASVLVSLIMIALLPADGPHPLDQSELARVRTLLDRWGAVDSLSYFALRDDRSVLFSRSGKSAVSYRVVGTVSLAAGDPLGDPEAWPGAIQAWLEEAQSFGWVPAVLGVSDRGARAYHRPASTRSSSATRRCSTSGSSRWRGAACASYARRCRAAPGPAWW